jgi:hypothetical protein
MRARSARASAPGAQLAGGEPRLSGLSASLLHLTAGKRAAGFVAAGDEVLLAHVAPRDPLAFFEHRSQLLVYQLVEFVVVRIRWSGRRGSARACRSTCRAYRPAGAGGALGC